MPATARAEKNDVEEWGIASCLSDCALSACFVVSAAYIHAETGAGHAAGWCEQVPAVAVNDKQS